MRTPGGQLAGSEFRLIDGRYLVYISPDGTLTANTYDAQGRVARMCFTVEVPDGRLLQRTDAL